MLRSLAEWLADWLDVHRILNSQCSWCVIWLLSSQKKKATNREWKKKNYYSLHILLNSSKLLAFWSPISFSSAFYHFISSCHVCLCAYDECTSFEAAVIAAENMIKSTSRIDRHFIKLCYVYTYVVNGIGISLFFRTLSFLGFLVSVQRHPIIFVVVVAAAAIVVVVVVVDFNVLRVQSHWVAFDRNIEPTPKRNEI